MSFNLATMLYETASAAPDKPCVIIGDTALTYAQVEELSGLVAGNLLSLGLERGAKVAVQLPNIPQFLFAYFGALRAGLVMVPLNPLLRAPEVTYHLENSDAQVLITCESFAEEAHRGASAVPGISTYVVDLGGGQRPEGTRPFDELLAPAEAPDIVPTNADDTAVLLYTSGTTGKPKGAELTHFQLYMNCSVAGDLIGFLDDDIVIAVLPMFHVFGLSSVLNAAVRFGIPSSRRPPSSAGPTRRSAKKSSRSSA
ncbi:MULTISPECIES: AMP-binding protein [unclassified Streptomyces]|uniref:AMP-binding protein n=1 Tax=unclassified Streptomyces TaxID=2593676 RepID=UPI002DD93DEE|nr:AMP-binding protein [Streptomyces sp. NBC_01445]WSE09692.1 AMP-binding protein [Streptomyces sp. NBC_01445]